MPFRTSYVSEEYGMYLASRQQNVYCVNNTSASDYGKCYVFPGHGKAIFVQTDTTTYPTLPCETDGTCTRYTSLVWDLVLKTAVDFSSVNKQLILNEFNSLSHGSYYGALGPQMMAPVLFVYVDSLPTVYPSTLLTYDTNNPRYGPYFKILVNRYSVPYAQMVTDVWMFPKFLCKTIVFKTWMNGLNNSWFAGWVIAFFSYESSPLAIIPLDYSEYLSYADIRSVFGYAANGIDQPGWNGDDIIRVLKEVFPDRTWAVFDDRTYTLYLYGLTMDDAIELQFVQRLSPTTVKVLDQSKKSDYTRFKEFYTKQISG